MKPIPLLSPSGVLYGFACGRCHMPRLGSERAAKLRFKPETDLVELSQQYAERCCRCHACGEPESNGAYCESCRAKQAAPVAKKRKANL